jgi:hypothetical protein
MANGNGNGNNNPSASAPASSSPAAPAASGGDGGVSVKDHLDLLESVKKLAARSDTLASQVSDATSRAAKAEQESAALRAELDKRSSAPVVTELSTFAPGDRDYMLQDPAEVAARLASRVTAIDTRPIQPGHYVVAGHTSVRSLEHTFKPGEAFTGALGDVDGLLKSGALVEVED